MKTLSRLISALLLSALPGQLVAAEPPPPIKATTRRADDRVEITQADDRALVTVRSPRGIGGATLQRTGKAWPGVIVVRLHLRGLESFTVAAGKRKLSASVLSHSGHKRLLHLWEDGKEKKIEPASPYWTQLGIFDARGKPIEKLPEQGGYFEITLPKALLSGQGGTLTLGWIDFYRG
ncbi:MAG: hypothetical protein HQ567_23170 [Candidatus Nealsonbacteria bacterium]|nr:hypothetical protein [Candidatus Nealsonbacteria bacterium]